MRRVRTGLYLLLAAPACASFSTGHSGPPAEPGREITTWVEALQHRAGHALFLRNDSPATIRIRSVTLHDCENLVEPCGQPVPVDVVMAPGQTRAVMRVHPRRSQDRVWFGWTYEMVRLD